MMHKATIASLIGLCGQGAAVRMDGPTTVGNGHHGFGDPAFRFVKRQPVQAPPPTPIDPHQAAMVLRSLAEQYRQDQQKQQAAEVTKQILNDLAAKEHAPSTYQHEAAHQATTYKNDDDAALQAALALSLQQPQPQPVSWMTAHGAEYANNAQFLEALGLTENEIRTVQRNVDAQVISDLIDNDFNADQFRNLVGLPSSAEQAAAREAQERQARLEAETLAESKRMAEEHQARLEAEAKAQEHEDRLVAEESLRMAQKHQERLVAETEAESLREAHAAAAEAEFARVAKEQADMFAAVQQSDVAAEAPQEASELAVSEPTTAAAALENPEAGDEDALSPEKEARLVESTKRADAAEKRAAADLIEKKIDAQEIPNDNILRRFLKHAISKQVLELSCVPEFNIGDDLDKIVSDLKIELSEPIRALFLAQPEVSGVEPPTSDQLQVVPNAADGNCLFLSIVARFRAMGNCAVSRILPQLAKKFMFGDGTPSASADSVNAGYLRSLVKEHVQDLLKQEKDLLKGDLRGLSQSEHRDTNKFLLQKYTDALAGAPAPREVDELLAEYVAHTKGIVRLDAYRSVYSHERFEHPELRLPASFPQYVEQYLGKNRAFGNGVAVAAVNNMIKDSLATNGLVLPSDMYAVSVYVRDGGAFVPKYGRSFFSETSQSNGHLAEYGLPIRLLHTGNSHWEYLKDTAAAASPAQPRPTAAAAAAAPAQQQPAALTESESMRLLLVASLPNEMHPDLKEIFAQHIRSPEKTSDDQLKIYKNFLQTSSDVPQSIGQILLRINAAIQREGTGSRLRFRGLPRALAQYVPQSVKRIG